VTVITEARSLRFWVVSRRELGGERKAPPDVKMDNASTTSQEDDNAFRESFFTSPSEFSIEDTKLRESQSIHISPSALAPTGSDMLLLLCS